MFFSRSSLVVWPKNHSLDLYFSKKDNNHFSFEFDLWRPIVGQDCQSLKSFLRSISYKKAYLVIPGDVIIFKSFVYESSIESINKDEILAMAQPSVDFDIDPDFLSYKLEQNDTKTIIRATFIDVKKIQILKTNLDKIGLNLDGYQSVSNLIANVISQFYLDNYCLIYPVDQPNYLFILAHHSKIYLTDIVKPISQDINKKINYSELYFGKLCEKFFQPADLEVGLKLNKNVPTNPFDESQISSRFGLASNLPIPVLSFLDAGLRNQLSQNFDIIKIQELENYQPIKPSMNQEAKPKNPLLIFLVFVVSLCLVSVILWFVMNRNNNSDIVSPTSDQSPTESEETIVSVELTETPTPAVDIDKDIKIRVLNATDINGQAATVKTSLVELGFTDIATGNSSEKVTQNTVRYKSTLASLPQYVKKNLASFQDAVYESNLEVTDTYDVVFIIGQNLSLQKISTTPSSTQNSPTPLTVDSHQ